MPGRPRSEPPLGGWPGRPHRRGADSAAAGRRETSRAWRRPLRPATRPEPPQPSAGPEAHRTGSPGKDAGAPGDPPVACGLGRSIFGAAREARACGRGGRGGSLAAGKGSAPRSVAETPPGGAAPRCAGWGGGRVAAALGGPGASLARGRCSGPGCAPGGSPHLTGVELCSGSIALLSHRLSFGGGGILGPSATEGFEQRELSGNQS